MGILFGAPGYAMANVGVIMSNIGRTYYRKVHKKHREYSDAVFGKAIAVIIVGTIIMVALWAAWGVV